MLCRRPVLLIPLHKAGTEAFILRLLPAVATAAFPLAKLAPERNNLRAPAGAAAASKAAGADKEEPDLPPTPRYNAAIVQVRYLGAIYLQCACHASLQANDLSICNQSS